MVFMTRLFRKMNIIKQKVETTDVNFWNALNIYISHPNCINKQVLYSETLYVGKSLMCLTFNDCQEIVNNYWSQFTGHFKAEYFGRYFEEQKNHIFLADGKLENCVLSNALYLIIRKLIPKKSVQDNFNFYEFAFLDKHNTCVHIFNKSFLTITTEMLGSFETKPLDPFITLKFNFLRMQFSNNYLDIFYDKQLNEKGVNWLNATFAPKFIKLMCNCDSYCKANKKSNFSVEGSKIDILQYYKMYDEMKSKYAKFFVENWSENTDPKKFVYEDIAIATYLLLLWNKGKIPTGNYKKQKFVDLGCGNGLLVHILNSEGHLGIGIDIRKRKIWDTYPLSTVLIEKTIFPAVTTTYPDADWLIGNHSDELTAWIPIMARLSNSHCQYFVLPCCPYELNGMKFQRKNSAFSSYQNFISYVKEISELCKFDTSVDKLRIPSTKRICLIGSNEVELSENEYNALKENIMQFIKNDNKKDDNTKGNLSAKNNKEFSTVKIRESKEPVRNCTKLSNKVINDVLHAVMNELLKETNLVTVMKNGKQISWNRGIKLSIRELAANIEENYLRQLKHECKGLQTLLKNHHFLFEVKQGSVQFRSPENLLELSEKFLKNHSSKWKIKDCWFFNHHPDKCPLSDELCSYKHGK